MNEFFDHVLYEESMPAEISFVADSSNKSGRPCIDEPGKQDAVVACVVDDASKIDEPEERKGPRKRSKRRASAR